MEIQKKTELLQLLNDSALPEKHKAQLSQIVIEHSKTKEKEKDLADIRSLAETLADKVKVYCRPALNPHQKKPGYQPYEKDDLIQLKEFNSGEKWIRGYILEVNLNKSTTEYFYKIQCLRYNRIFYRNHHEIKAAN